MIHTHVETDKYKRLLAALPPELKTATRDQNERSANEMAARLRRIAPRKSGVLVSTIHVEKTGDIAFTVEMGGPKTEKVFRSGSSYSGDVVVGAGRRTSGFTKGGAGKLKFDYSRGLEFGFQRRGGGAEVKDPSFVPARRIQVKKHRGAMTRRLNAAIKAMDAK